VQQRERGEVHRVRNVDDDLAIELTSVGAEHVVDGRVQDRKHDDVALQTVAELRGAHVTRQLAG
jgi:hypothetical protein